MPKIAELLKGYAYNPGKPTYSVHSLTIYDAQNKQNGLKYTLKIYKQADSQLAAYLQKMKSAGSQYIVKFIDIVNEPQTNQLLVIQQYTPYGNLANALIKSKRMEDEDAITIVKQLLNGHIDLIRTGVFWSGNEGDIDVTENGIKLSWNNSVIYSQNNPNPFPDLIERISTRKNQDGILPFPPNKMILDLIKVSKQNASEMSLHPLLKKRDKIFKKKGRNWFAFKQYKIKGQYGQQLTYTVISRQHGLLRVKYFDKGQIDQNLIKIYQSKPSFTKLIQYYEEGESLVTVSEYANDGSVQSYVKRLKSSNTQLKQNQIQFIFFSLIEPLKYINASPVISLNMLHIKNIYIENGIPKIGQVSPMNNKLRQVLKERADVPDFYFKDFKEDASKKQARFDTYSLGVLLYKLMFTEYPIFPENKVHIPTTPNYKKSLKDMILLFLDTGGNLTDLEKQLQVSDDIKNQVKQNQKLLNVSIGKGAKTILELEQQKKQQNQYNSQLSIGQEQPNKIEGQVVSNKDCKSRLWIWLSKRGKDHDGKYRKIHLSNYAFYRKCTSIITILLLYFLAFFIPYMIGFYNLITSTRLFFPATLNILGQNHKFIITNYEVFQSAVNSLGTITSTAQVTNTLKCILDDKNLYYQFLKPTSPHWYIFLMASLIAMIIILVLKAKQVANFGLIRVAHHYYDQTIDGANQSRFVVSSFVFFQLWFAMCLYAFFYLFNFIFLQQHNPCVGGNNWSSLTQSLLTDRMDFTLKYLIILVVTFIMGILSFAQLNNLYALIPYNSLCNPICIFTPIYLALFIAMRIGALNYFSPSFANNSSGLIASNYINFIGYFPELLLVLQLGLQILIDFIFYKWADKSIETFVLTNSGPISGETLAES